MKLKEMNRDERSLLLYLETRVVDHGGLVDTRHMNSDDDAIADKWVDKGFIQYGRVAFEDIKKSSACGYWCDLSNDAWSLAHEERRARAKRMADDRTWRRTEEL